MNNFKIDRLKVLNEIVIFVKMEEAKKPGNKGFATKRVISDLTKGMGKVPPQAPDLEEAVLGALMLEKDALTEVVEVLQPETFYVDKHKAIYTAIVDLFQLSDPIDLLTVINRLRTTGELERAGGEYYVAKLTSKVNSASNIEYHARIIAERAIKRSLIGIASEIEKDAYEETVDVFELLDRTEKHLFDVSESNIRKNYAGMHEIMREAIEQLEERRDQADGLTGVASGFTALDRVTSGWQKSDLVIIAARPAMGKTAFILSAVRNAAVDFQVPCAVFSLEMSSVQLVNRLISSEAELESDKIRKGNLEEYEWTQLHHKITKLDSAPIYIDDTPALSILELRAKCRKMKQQHGIGMVVIDYLQLMHGDSGSRKTGNREQEIASISRALKNIAKELEVPVIALSQLSRAVESRTDKRPQLSDLRESGSIEQDADQVMFLYRPEYYGITEDEEGNPMTGVGEVIIAKNRHGSIEDVQLRFIGQFTKFCDLDSGSMGGGFPSAPTDFDSEDTGAITISSRVNENDGLSDPPF